VQGPDASLVSHNNVEKELVASRILAANYKEQRDEARKNWQESEKAKTDIRRNWNVKSAEMSRLHGEIRRLKGEKPRISEGIRADSGSVGEVEGLIDLSMEED
jgi:predicted nuclease with TOPRIM domain